MANRDGLESLVAAAQRGDGDAFEALARRFRTAMLVVAQGECGSRDLAEDAVQDGLLVAFRALKNLDDPQRFGPWLAAIVRNRTRRLARSGGRTSGFPAEELATPPPAPPSPAQEAIHGLPEGIRESMLLYYLETWSVGEISAFLERPTTTVKWQLHAGRALLRKRLGSPENV